MSKLENSEILPQEEHGKVGSFVSSDLRGKPTNAEFIRLQYCGMIELSVQDIKTYRGTLGKYTLVRYDFALLGKRNQGKNPILRNPA